MYKKTSVFKKIIICLLILFTTFTSTSCWNYKDLNKSRLVAGLCIDFDEINNQYIVTSEIINLATSNKTGELFRSSGKSIFEAIRKCTNKNGRRLIVAHVKIIVISKELANSRLFTILDYLLRDPEYPSDLYLFVSDTEKAADIFELCEKTKNSAGFSFDVTSFNILDSIKNHHIISKFSKIPVWKFAKELYEECKCSYLPLLNINTLNNINFPFPSGIAVFKNNCIVGTLTHQEAIYHEMLINKLKGGIIPITITDENNRASELSLQVLHSKSKIKPIYENGQLSMTIDIDIEAAVAEISSGSNFLDKNRRPLLVSQSSKFIEHRIDDLLDKLQREYKADILSFATKTKSYVPEFWSLAEENWDFVFSRLPVKINLDFKIVSSALTNRTMQLK